MTASRYGVFCLILFFGVLALGVQNYEVWSRSAGAVIKREVPKKPEAKTEAPPSAPSKGEAAGGGRPAHARCVRDKLLFVGSSQLLFDSVQVSCNSWIGAAQCFHAPYGANHGRVISVAKSTAQFWEAAL